MFLKRTGCLSFHNSQILKSISETSACFRICLLITFDCSKCQFPKKAHPSAAKPFEISLTPSSSLAMLCFTVSAPQTTSRLAVKSIRSSSRPFMEVQPSKNPRMPRSSCCSLRPFNNVAGLALRQCSLASNEDLTAVSYPDAPLNLRAVTGLVLPAIIENYECNLSIVERSSTPKTARVRGNAFVNR